VAEPDRPVIDLHGTATAAVAGAPANGVGMLGLWPGARMLNVGTGNLEGFTCGETVRAISTAIRARAAVLNLSIGSEGACYAQYEAVSEAIARGILVVAAAGNERLRRTESGEVNPVTYPAAFPHVLSVAAFGTRGGSSRFSTANGAVDLAAPGESVLTAVPPAFDDDGRRDGYARLDGTSFSAPIVAGAAAWILAARPDLRAEQVARLLRTTARDIDARGWDPSSGFGALDLPDALGAAPPGRDRSEINDDVEWVDGRRYVEPDPLVWRGGAGTTFTASADGWKDRSDVYRVRLPAGRRVRITLTPPPGADVDVALFSRNARTVFGRRGLLAASIRGDGRTDRITYRARRATTAYVAVLAPRSRTEREPGVTYRLAIRRG
jgi:subtilisin family serine protease